MIDITKPLQLADGRAALFVRLGPDGYVRARVGSGIYNFNRVTGKHRYQRFPNLKNVPETAKEPTVPAKTFEFADISVELSRTYTFPGGDKVVIEAPVRLNVSPSHSHRLVDASGAAHYVPSGWLHLTWRVKDGAPPFVA